MKKILLTLMVSALIFGCKSTSATETKLNRNAQVMLKGDWVLDRVTTPASNFVAINSFGMADSACFEGSTWHFISNNNKGDMKLNAGGNCPSFSSPITWFINRDNQFVLKVLNAGEKAKRVRDGYVLYLQNQSENEFELYDMVDVAGKQSKVVYHFSRR